MSFDYVDKKILIIEFGDRFESQEINMKKMKLYCSRHSRNSFSLREHVFWF